MKAAISIAEVIEMNSLVSVAITTAPVDWVPRTLERNQQVHKVDLGGQCPKRMPIKFVSVSANRKGIDDMTLIFHDFWLADVALRWCIFPDCSLNKDFSITDHPAHWKQHGNQGGLWRFFVYVRVVVHIRQNKILARKLGPLNPRSSFRNAASFACWIHDFPLFYTENMSHWEKQKNCSRPRSETRKLCLVQFGDITLIHCYSVQVFSPPTAIIHHLWCLSLSSDNKWPGLQRKRHHQGSHFVCLQARQVRTKHRPVYRSFLNEDTLR